MNFITKFLYGNKIKELLNHGKEHFEDENYFNTSNREYILRFKIEEKGSYLVKIYL